MQSASNQHMREPPPAAFDPSTLNDPVATKTGWGPAAYGGASFATLTLAEAPGVLRFRRTPKNLLLVSVLLGAGAIALLGGLTGLACWILDTPIPVLAVHATPGPPAFLVAWGLIFGGCGWVFLTAVGSPTFDRTSGMFSKKGKPGAPGDPDSCRLGEIHALQLLSEYFPARGSGKNRISAYYSHELNLVLKDGRRINAVDHGDPALLRDNATRIARFLGCKLWDAIPGAAIAPAAAARPVSRLGIASALVFVAIIGSVLFFVATRVPEPRKRSGQAVPAVSPSARASVTPRPATPVASPGTRVPPLPGARMESVSLREGSVMSLLQISGSGFGLQDNHRVALSGKDFVIYPEVVSWSADFISMKSPSDPRIVKGNTYTLRIERISPPGVTEPVAFRYEALGHSQSVAVDPKDWTPPPASGAPEIRITAADPPIASPGKLVTLAGRNFGAPGGLQILAESAAMRIELQAVEWSDRKIVLRFPGQSIRPGEVDPGTAFYYRLVGPVSSSNPLPFDLGPVCGLLTKKFVARCERALAGHDECATQRTLQGMSHCLATTSDPELRAQCARMPIDRQRAACEAQFRAEQICKGQADADAFFACFEKNMPPNWRDDMPASSP